MPEAGRTQALPLYEKTARERHTQKERKMSAIEKKL
jgi:hypothetical protein